MFCINIGNDLRVYSQEHVNSFLDSRVCGASSAQIRFKYPPTFHAFRQLGDKAHDSQLLIGLSNGEIRIIDPLKEDLIKTFNETVCLLFFIK